MAHSKFGKRALGENGELTLPEGGERIGYQVAEELQVKVKIPDGVKVVHKDQLYTTRDSFAKVSIKGLDKVKIK